MAYKGQMGKSDAKNGKGRKVSRRIWIGVVHDSAARNIALRLKLHSMAYWCLYMGIRFDNQALCLCFGR